jgi:CheY-like chemotaxis protein
MLSVIHKPLKPRLLETSLAYAMRISRRILIADDLEANRIILAHMYRHLGIEVEQAASGTEAIAMLRERPYRYLVLDEHLGDMLGREVVTALRSMEVPWRHMPVISSTATAKADEIEAAYDDLLPKPIELDQLRQLLRRWGPAPQEAAPGT